MRVKDQDLLLKDLCGRLPYGVKCIANSDGYAGVISSIESQYGVATFDDGRQEEICDIKPYLFPLSSMTEESAKELYEMYGFSDEETWIANYIKANNVYGLKLFSEIGFLVENDLDILLNWLHKYQFDYRGLIEKGLAIDATGLNIY